MLQLATLPCGPLCSSFPSKTKPGSRLYFLNIPTPITPLCHTALLDTPQLSLFPRQDFGASCSPRGVLFLRYPH